MNITGEEILKVLAKDPRFSKMPLGEIMALTPHILKMPEILGKELLSEKVNIPSVLKAKIAFMKHCVDNGLTVKMAEIIIENLTQAGEKAKGMARKVKEFDLSVDKFTKKVDKALSTMIATLSNLLDDKLKHPTPIRLTSHLLRAMNMSDSTISMCEDENFTIADLLLVEPYVFLFNLSTK